MAELILRAPCAGWLGPLEDVPDPVFAGRMLGDGLALDPLEDVLHAPADGVVTALHEVGHAVTLGLANGAELLLHFGLETVALGGEGFTPLVRVGDRVRSGQPLLRADLDAIAPRVKSLVTPIVVTETAGHVLSALRDPCVVALGDPVLALSPAGGSARPPIARGTPFAAEASQSVRIPLAHGLHARPAARLAQVARQFDAEIRLVSEEASARLASPSAVLALGAGHGDTITVAAQGPAARAAVAAVVGMIAGGMDEAAPFPADARESPATAPPPPAAMPAPAMAAGSILIGVCAAPGMGIGPAWLAVRPEPEIEPAGAGLTEERARFAQVRSALLDRLGQEANPIFAAHQALLEDPDLLDEVDQAMATGASAGLAWRQVMRGRAAALRRARNPLFAERAADFDDLELRLQWQLAGREMPVPTAPDNAIVIAADLLPSQVAELDPARVAGLALAHGGPTSHAAIIAASKGIPALVALGDALLTVAPGTTLALDADGQRVLVDPPQATRDELAAELAEAGQRAAAAKAAAGQEGRTADGTRIEVFANLGKQADAAPALANGAEGCGLLRTEFLFLDRANAPTEDEQCQEYAAIGTALEGRPLIVRLLDIGGDKPAPYLPIGPEENPALGLRGIRVSLARRDVLQSQLRAILRATAAGDLRIMAPMIARLDELRALRDAVRAEAMTLGVEQPPLGVMVETPAAAMIADLLAAECDFLSIGTNDLTQYTLAMDRGNPAVASGIDGLDPAVLRMIAQCCAGAARHGKPVGVCGGLASDRLAVPLLIGLGVTELSAVAAKVPEVKAIVRALDLMQCRSLAEHALALPTAAEVRALGRGFLREKGL
ncbi:MAG TPA: phosphoenolpyruvate--protein phosphotransferase [Novosphingobium sp.]